LSGTALQQVDCLRRPLAAVALLLLLLLLTAAAALAAVVDLRGTRSRCCGCGKRFACNCVLLPHALRLQRASWAGHSVKEEESIVCTGSI
jgi:hypothetical protein